MHFVIRLINPHDIDAILAIENRSFSLPFTRQMFEALLSQEPFDSAPATTASAGRQGRPFGGFVAEAENICSGGALSPPSGDRGGSPLLGYLIYSLVIDEMQILTIAVDAPYRGQGIASALIQKMFDAASGKKVRKIFLEVRPSNAAAQALYAKFGFKKIGLRRNYYKDNGEDAMVMEKGLL